MDSKAKLKTLKDIVWDRQSRDDGGLTTGDAIKAESIKHIKDALKKEKNMFKAWIYSLDITEEDLK